MNKLILIALSFCLLNFHGIYACNVNHSNFLAEVDSIGRKIIAWPELENYSHALNVSIFNPDNSLSSSSVISGPGHFCKEVQIIINSQNDLFVFWLAKTPSTTYSLYMAKLPFGGSWSLPSKLSSPNSQISLETFNLHRGPDEQIHVFWEAITTYTDQNLGNTTKKVEGFHAKGNITSWEPAVALITIKTSLTPIN